jgi:hypothetical protein
MGLPKSGNESQIQVEDILEPLNSCGRLVCQDLDQIWSGLVSGRLKGIIVKLLHAIANLLVDLCSSEGSVDSGSGLGGVTTEET